MTRWVRLLRLRWLFLYWLPAASRVRGVAADVRYTVRTFSLLTLVISSMTPQLGTSALGKRTPGRRPDDARYLLKKALQRRDMKAPDALFTPMANPPTLSTAATFASGAEISGASVFGSLATMLRRPSAAGAFTYAGSGITRTSPIGGNTEGVSTAGYYSSNTSAPPHDVEFEYSDYVATTVAAGSNGAALPQATVNITSGTGFPKSGSATVATSAGVQTITYTGVTSTTLTGCAGGTGTMSTGAAVAPTTASIDILFGDHTATAITVVLDGQLVTFGATFSAPGNTGAPVRGTISGLSLGRHKIKLLNSGGTQFAGIVASPTATIRAVNAPTLQMNWLTASFGEPTTADNRTDNSFLGVIQHLGRILGVDCRSIGKGGTGYVNPGSYVPVGQRLPDGLKDTPDILGFLGDLAMNDGAYAPATVATAATAVWDAAHAARPEMPIIVCGPTWPRDQYTFSSNLLGIRDALRDAAAARPWILFLDLLQMPVDVLAQTTGFSQAATTSGSATITSDQPFSIGTVVQIDSGLNAEQRTVQTCTGSGPYTLNVNEVGNSLTLNHAQGVAIKHVGGTMRTGSGRLGAPNGTGNADWATGIDLTHPTLRGHIDLAILIFWLLKRLLNA